MRAGKDQDRRREQTPHYVRAYVTNHGEIQPTASTTNWFRSPLQNPSNCRITNSRQVGAAKLAFHGLREILRHSLSLIGASIQSVHLWITTKATGRLRQVAVKKTERIPRHQMHPHSPAQEKISAISPQGGECKWEAETDEHTSTAKQSVG